jgi:hypothetical protein
MNTTLSIKLELKRAMFLIALTCIVQYWYLHDELLSLSQEILISSTCEALLFVVSIFFWLRSSRAIRLLVFVPLLTILFWLCFEKWVAYRDFTGHLHNYLPHVEFFQGIGSVTNQATIHR